MKKSTKVILLGIITILMALMQIIIPELNSSHVWWGITAFFIFITIGYWIIPSREQRLKKAHEKKWKERQRISN